MVHPYECSIPRTVFDSIVSKSELNSFREKFPAAIFVTAADLSSGELSIKDFLFASESDLEGKDLNRIQKNLLTTDCCLSSFILYQTVSSLSWELLLYVDGTVHQSPSF